MGAQTIQQQKLASRQKPRNIQLLILDFQQEGFLLQEELLALDQIAMCWWTAHIFAGIHW